MSGREPLANRSLRERLLDIWPGAWSLGPGLSAPGVFWEIPDRKDTQTVMNLKIKYRESFRPFAPTVLEDKADQYFDIDRPSPYMLLVADVKKHRRLPQPSKNGLTMLERLR